MFSSVCAGRLATGHPLGESGDGNRFGKGVLKCHSAHLQTTVSLTRSTIPIDVQELSARETPNALTKVPRSQ
jgi:hypothetical protein